jgi:3-deoxy-manno-octulosonate cytidylyltransferase (CMP-KDO synthetase)
MQRLAIIPARFASTRLPGKPLLDICGKPMLLRVYEQALKSSMDRVIIATDDQRIFDEMTKFGCEICMTSSNHQSGTDRLAEVAEQLNLSDDDIVVNVQGDEPLIPPEVVNQVSELLISNTQAAMSTLSTLIDDTAMLNDPNVVKVISNIKGEAIYFSRALIPFQREQSSDTEYPYQRHIGIYGYRVEFLKRFSQWSPCELETMESLEQLRVLWQGETIQIAEAVVVPAEGVDTENDLIKIRKLIQNS